MAISLKVNVVIAHPDAIVRFGLVSMINSHARLRVGGEAKMVREVRGVCSQIRPAVVLLDPQMNGGEGFCLISDIFRWVPTARIIAISSTVDLGSVQRAFQAGVSAYLTLEDRVEVVLSAIDCALGGERCLGVAVERRLIDRLSAGSIESADELERALSDREMQVFRLAGGGRAAREIAETLGVSVKTVESHQERIKEKLRLRSASELRQRAACYCASLSGSDRAEQITQKAE